MLIRFPMFLLAASRLLLAAPNHSFSALSLPPSAQWDLPSCAALCVQEFISSSFADCPMRLGRQDLRCICQSKSVSGLTLGEGSLQCIVSSCSSISINTLKTAYNICSSITNAQIPTHSILSASISQPTTIAFQNPTSSRDSSTSDDLSAGTSTPVRSTSTSSSTEKLLPTSPAGNLQTESRDPSPSRFFSSSQTSHAAPAETQLSARPGAATTEEENIRSAEPILSRGQVAGVSVAGAVVGIAAIALVAFLFCCGSKKVVWRKRNTSFDRMEKPIVPNAIRSPTDSLNFPCGSVREKQTFQARVGAPGGPGQKRFTLWRYALSKHSRSPGVSCAVSIDGNMALTQESSPHSVKSYKTTSKLLPDKPTFKVPTTYPPRCSGEPQRNIIQETSAGPSLKIIAPSPPPVIDRTVWKEDNSGQNIARDYLSLRRVLSDPFISESLDAENGARKPQGHSVPLKKTSHTFSPIVPIDSSAPVLFTQRASELPQSTPGYSDLYQTPLNPAQMSQHAPPYAHHWHPPGMNIQSDHHIPRKQTATPSRHLAQTFQPLQHISTRLPISPLQSSQQFNEHLPIASCRRSRQRPETCCTTESDTSFEDDAEELKRSLKANQQPYTPLFGRKVPVETTRPNFGQYPTVPGSSAERSITTLPPKGTRHIGDNNSKYFQSLCTPLQNTEHWNTPDHIQGSYAKPPKRDSRKTFVTN